MTDSDKPKRAHRKNRTPTPPKLPEVNSSAATVSSAYATDRPKYKPHTPPQNQVMLTPEENSNFINNALEIANLPEFNLYTADAESTTQRINAYFSITSRNQVKPSLSGLALALCVNRNRIWEIVNDTSRSGKPIKLNPGVSVSVKKAYDIMNVLIEDYMQNGKVNPVSGIFLMKNNFGYKDQTEIVARTDTTEQIETSDIRQRYLQNQKK